MVSSAGETPMTWYGEHLWRAQLPDDAIAEKICATDAAGNETCPRNALIVRAVGAGAGNRTRMSVGSGDFKYSREGGESTFI